MRGSYEELFHATGIPSFWLDLREESEAIALLGKKRLQRAINVTYRPDTERWSHYLEVRLPAQFDLMIPSRPDTRAAAAGAELSLGGRRIAGDFSERVVRRRPVDLGTEPGILGRPNCLGI